MSQKIRSEMVFAWHLFRFLQLLCEGHFEEFQDFLRTQVSDESVLHQMLVIMTVSAWQQQLSQSCRRHSGLPAQDTGHILVGHSASFTVNVSQESINDIYVFVATDTTVTMEHLHLFTDAIWVAKQVFKTLTEYIQGPCVGNQIALARSRLWDAVLVSFAD